MISDQEAQRPKMDEESVDLFKKQSTLEEEEEEENAICDLTAQKFSRIVDLKGYVDKTLFIKAFLETNNDLIVTLTPAVFGKSTNMDMVKEFLNGNKKLFEDNQLKIWKEEKFFFNNFCQKNPVIHIDFGKLLCMNRTKKDVLQSFSRIIHNAFRAHSYLIRMVGKKLSWSDNKLEKMDRIENFEKYWEREYDLSRFEIINGLRILSEYLNVYYNKHVYILIDDYDDPIMKAIETNSEDEVLNEIIDLIQAIISTLFENKEVIKKGLITGCVRIAEVLPEEAINIKYYDFLSDSTFSPYFGFTDKEVKSLFEKDEFVKFKNGKIQKWYNGYKLIHTNEYTIYSSYSVLNYLVTSSNWNKPKFGTYWFEPRSILKLEQLFLKPEIEKLIQDLIDRKLVEIKTVTKITKKEIKALWQLIHQDVSEKDAHLFLEFLVLNGYLNVVSTDGNGTKTLSVPNNEIVSILKNRCYSALLSRPTTTQINARNIHNYEEALKLLLLNRDKKAFIRFAKAVSELFSTVTTMPQNVFEFRSILFFWAFNKKEFIVHSDTKRDRIMVNIRDVAMILELKFDQDEDKDQDQNEEEDEDREEDEDEKEQGNTAFDDFEKFKVKIVAHLHMNKARKVTLTYSVDNSDQETVTSIDEMK